MTEGKTDLLPKFISKKGRPFSAHLKLENGKIGFEFAEKKPRAKKDARNATQPRRTFNVRRRDDSFARVRICSCS